MPQQRKETPQTMKLKRRSNSEKVQILSALLCFLVVVGFMFNTDTAANNTSGSAATEDKVLKPYLRANQDNPVQTYMQGWDELNREIGLESTSGKGQFSDTTKYANANNQVFVGDGALVQNQFAKGGETINIYEGTTTTVDNDTVNIDDGLIQLTPNDIDHFVDQILLDDNNQVTIDLPANSDNVENTQVVIGDPTDNNNEIIIEDSSSLVTIEDELPQDYKQDASATVIAAAEENQQGDNNSSLSTPIQSNESMVDSNLTTLEEELIIAINDLNDTVTDEENQLDGNRFSPVSTKVKSNHSMANSTDTASSKEFVTSFDEEHELDDDSAESLMNPNLKTSAEEISIETSGMNNTYTNPQNKSFAQGEDEDAEIKVTAEKKESNDEYLEDDDDYDDSTAHGFVTDDSDDSLPTTTSANKSTVGDLLAMNEVNNTEKKLRTEDDEKQLENKLAATNETNSVEAGGEDRNVKMAASNIAKENKGGNDDEEESNNATTAKNRTGEKDDEHVPMDVVKNSTKTNNANLHTIGYFITLTETNCNNEMLSDVAMVLKHSIESISYPLRNSSLHTATLNALIYNNKSLSCANQLRSMGYNVLSFSHESDDDSAFPFKQKERDLNKTLFEIMSGYEAAVKLRDFDTLLLKPLDDLFDAMLLPNGERKKKIRQRFNESSLMSPSAQEQGIDITESNIDSIYTVRGRKDRSFDFFVVRSDPQVYKDLEEMATEAYNATSKEKAEKTFETSLSHYFLTSTSAVELDRCQFHPDSCNKTKGLQNVRLFHFGSCERPWTCPDTPVTPLCEEMHKKWINLRRSVESKNKSLKGTNTTIVAQEMKQDDANEDFKPHLFKGFCRIRHDLGNDIEPEVVYQRMDL